MVTFVQPDIAPIQGPWWKPSYQLRGDYTATWTAADGRVLRIVVPDGFCSDGSSEWLLLVAGLLPAALLWAFGVSADGPHRAAALVHDLLYRRRGMIRYWVQIHASWVLSDAPLTRGQADHAFRALAIAGGMPRWRSLGRWVVLRIVGWAWWLRP